jgi:hypothetical protein
LKREQQHDVLRIRPKRPWLWLFGGLAVVFFWSGFLIDPWLFTTAALSGAVAWCSARMCLVLEGTNVVLYRPPGRPIKVDLDHEAVVMLDHSRPIPYFPEMMFFRSSTGEVIVLRTWFWSGWREFFARVEETAAALTRERDS